MGKLRKRVLWSLLAVCLILISGCGKVKKEDMSEKMLATQTVYRMGKASLEGASVSKYASQIQEDETYRYICSYIRIDKVHKETGESEILWQSELGEPSKAMFNDGRALLIGNRLYFVELYSPETETFGISVIRTDGTGYEKLKHIFGTMCTYADTIYCRNHILYVLTDKGEIAYRVYADGSLSGNAEKIDNMDTYMKRGYRPAYCADNQGFSIGFSDTMETNDYALLSDPKGVLYVLDRASAEKLKGPKVLAEGEKIVALNSQYFILKNETQLSLLDRKTLAITPFLSFEEDYEYQIIGIQEDILYFSRKDKRMEEGQEYDVMQISLTDGAEQVLFQQTETDFAGMYYNSGPPCSLQFNQESGMFYRVDVEDYAMYICGYTRDGEKHRMSENFYDSGIHKYGSIATGRHEIYGHHFTDTVMLTADLERFVLRDTFPGAERINETLRQDEEAYIALCYKEIEEAEERMRMHGFFQEYSLNNSFIEVTYGDENYLSILQEECWDYEAYGGQAWEWKPYTFDLQTGERLTLPDIIGNSEEELKSIATTYFTTYVDENSKILLEGILEIIEENTTLQSKFYLTPKGITFFMDPHVVRFYGFYTIVIPYEEFDMKIHIMDSE